MKPDIKTIQALHDCLEAIEPGTVTKLFIYREAACYLPENELEPLIDEIYDAYIKDKIWIDLATFSKNVALSYRDFGNLAACIKCLLDNQEGLV